MSDDIASSFKRSTNLYDLMSVGEIRFQPAEKNNMVQRRVHGAEVRPLHIFAQYGLLVPGMKRLKENPNIQGGRY